MSLLLKRRMQEKERRNGLADQIEVPSFFIQKKPVEPAVIKESHNVESWSFTNNNNNNFTAAAAVTMPKDLEQIQNALPTMSHQKNQKDVINFQTNSGWTICNPPATAVAKDSQHQVSTVDNNNSNIISLPEGSYYDCPIIIDPVSYQQQQTESFSILPSQQHQPNLALQQQSQLQCTNVNCTHCKNSVNGNTS